MVILRHFTEQDASFVCEGLYPDLTIDEAVTMIREWNSGVHMKFSQEKCEKTT